MLLMSVRGSDLARSHSLQFYPAKLGAQRLVAIVAISITFAASVQGQRIQPSTLPNAQANSQVNALDSHPVIRELLSGDLLPEERVNMAVYETCNRGVVHIETRSAAIDSFLQVSVREGSGSGSVIDNNGMILTNQHVVDGAREISVRMHNGLSYPAVIVGQDQETDIAILQVKAEADLLYPISWHDNGALRVGQRIYAIGNPFGLERTMSKGMISSLNRQIASGKRRTMRSLIQIDGSLNQGNSGGPLLNTKGELIGMNTAIMSSDGDSAGVGFAIPVSTLQRIVPQLIQNGRVVRATIGITRVLQKESGLLIVSLAENGPADRAGLQGYGIALKRMRQGGFTYEQQVIDPSTADLLTAIDGQPVNTADELLAIIEKKQPGERVVVTITRDGRSVEVPITLGQSN